MTPELSELLPPPEVLPVEVDGPSMTLCLTHSPNTQLDKVSPDEPNNDCSTDCLKEHELPESHEMPSVPLKPFRVFVKFVAGTAPQNEVFGRHLHSRF